MNINKKLVILFLCIALIPAIILEGISISEISDDYLDHRKFYTYFLIFDIGPRKADNLSEKEYI